MRQIAGLLILGMWLADLAHLYVGFSAWPAAALGWGLPSCSAQGSTPRLVANVLDSISVPCCCWGWPGARGLISRPPLCSCPMSTW